MPTPTFIADSCIQIWEVGPAAGYLLGTPHGRIFPICPFAHRGIVILGPVVAQHLEQENTVRRTEASLSIGERRLLRGYPFSVEDQLNLLQ